MRVIIHNTIRVAEIVELPEGADIEATNADRAEWADLGIEVLETITEFIEPETVREFHGEDPCLETAHERAARRDVGYWSELVRHSKDKSWKPP